MTITTFRLYGRSELEKLELAVAERLVGWQAAWLTQADVCCRASMLHVPPVPPAGFSETVGADVERWAHVQIDDAGASDLLSAIYGGPAEPGVAPVLRPVVTQCLQELLCALAGDAQMLAAPEVEQWLQLSRPGSGCVSLEVQVGAALLPVVVAPQLAGQLIPKPHVKTGPNKPAARGAAIQRRTVTLDVELGHAELDLDALAGLQVGDVILFEQAAAEPLTVRLRQGETVCRGYLGLSDGAPAIQVSN